METLHSCIVEGGLETVSCAMCDFDEACDQEMAKAERLIGYAIRLNINLLDKGQRAYLKWRAKLHEPKYF